MEYDDLAGFRFEHDGRVAVGHAERHNELFEVISVEQVRVFVEV